MADARGRLPVGKAKVDHRLGDSQTSDCHRVERFSIVCEKRAKVRERVISDFFPVSRFGR